MTHEPKIFTGPEDLNEVNWLVEPVFVFSDEVPALETLEFLGEDLKAAREQVEAIMRYMRAAVKAAGAVSSRQAIINHSGLARQTVYDVLPPTNGQE